MSYFNKIKLSDFVYMNPTERLPKGNIARKISMDQIEPYKKFVFSTNYEPYSGGAKFRNGDTIMARITPCLENGKTAFVSGLVENEIAFGSTEYIVLRAKENISIPDFVYYLTISSIVREPAIKSMVGSSGRQRVQQSVLDELEIPLFSITDQQHIVDILGTLDDKIENNNQMIQEYENLIELYFNNLLVEKEEKWEEVSLLDIAEYTNGLAMQKYRPKGTDYFPVVKIKELSQGHVDSNSEQADISIDEKNIIDDGDIIFAWSGTLMVKIWCGGKAGLNQHLFKVTSQKYPKWFVYLWTKYHLIKFQNIAKGKAVTMGHIKRDDLKKSIAFIPTPDELERYNNIIEPVFEKIIHLHQENRTISELKSLYLQKFFG